MINRTTITIEQVEDSDGTRRITVSGNKNGYSFFYESFEATSDKPLDISTVDSQKVENHNPFDSASRKSLQKLLADINTSRKTDGRYIGTKETDIKFPILGMNVIRNFEKLANVKFDYDRFKTVEEFQCYFREMLK